MTNNETLRAVKDQAGLTALKISEIMTTDYTSVSHKTVRNWLTDPESEHFRAISGFKLLLLLYLLKENGYNVSDYLSDE